MKKFLKWFGIVVGALLVLVLISAFSLHVYGKNRLDRAPQVVTHPVTVPTDGDTVARGEYLVDAVSQCRMCHGEKLEGQVFVEGEMGIYLAAPNLTSGKGGIGATFSDADWERAIRHGIGGDGRVLVIMPSNYYSQYNNSDLGDLIAYLKQIPAVDNELGSRQIGFPGSIMGGVIGFNDFTHVGDIDHAAVGAAQAASPAETAEYGHYLVQIAMCSECHAPDLSGISGAAGQEGPPAGPNLTPAGDLGQWSQSDFLKAIHTGQTPDKRSLNPDEMPWNRYGIMTDLDLHAIWLYLQSLPATPTAQ